MCLLVIEPEISLSSEAAVAVFSYTRFAVMASSRSLGLSSVWNEKGAHEKC